MSEDVAIRIKNVTMKYQLLYDNGRSLKDYILKALKRELRYDEFLALDDVSFEVRKGQVLGIIGRNGAGKSTLLKIVSGILKPTSGSVECVGNIVPMLELGSGFDFDLSGRENIYLNGAILGYSKDYLDSKLDEIIEFSELDKFIDIPIRNYSSGMLMRLAFSIATIVEPEILIVDEILAVGDEAYQTKSRKRMMELMAGGTTVLFVSHALDSIKEMCEKVIWLDRGAIRMMGNTESAINAYETMVTQETAQ